jgi:hypothetical protein
LKKFFTILEIYNENKVNETKIQNSNNSINSNIFLQINNFFDF